MADQLGHPSEPHIFKWLFSVEDPLRRTNLPTLADRNITLKSSSSFLFLHSNPKLSLQFSESPSPLFSKFQVINIK